MTPARHPPVLVTRREAERLRRGRLWVSRDRLAGGLAGRRAGEIVEVLDSSGEWIGRGFVEAEGGIAVRIATNEPREALDFRWVTARLRHAWSGRERAGLFRETNAFRLVNAEGDGLPALALDWYDGHVAGLANNPAWSPLEGALAEGLATLPGFRGFGWKRPPESGRDEVGAASTSMRPVRAREPETGPRTDRYRHVSGEESSEDLVVTIDGLRLHAGIRHGLNTGLFLDQRENRRVIAARCVGATLCNAFAYTGAFSVAAALAGAARVTTIDLARRAVEGARANFALNGIEAAPHEFVVGDVFEEFRRWTRAGRRFDAVLLDPPSFATGSRRVFSSVQHYGELVALAAGLLPSDGLLVASCNTANWARSAFVHALHGGARAAGRTLRLLESRGLPPDFPVPRGLPEMAYLKFVIGSV